MKRLLLLCVPFAIGVATRAVADPVKPAVREFFETADRVEIISIDPEVHRAWGYSGEKEASPLATWKTALDEGDGVFGRVDLSASERGPVLRALFEGIAAPPTPAAGCYDPRHAIVAHKGSGKEEQIAAIHVCFACNGFVLLDASTTESKEAPFADVGGLQTLLNGLLKAAKVPLAADVEKARASRKPIEKDVLSKALSERARKVLEAPDSLELVALEVGPGHARKPSEAAAKSPLAAELELLASDVRGRVRLTRPTGIRSLIDEIERELVVQTTRTCWNPRHALIVSRGDEKLVVTLCFECMAAIVIDADGEHPIQPFAATPELKRRLNAILTSHGVEPAPETGQSPPAK